MGGSTRDEEEMGEQEDGRNLGCTRLSVAPSIQEDGVEVFCLRGPEHWWVNEEGVLSSRYHSGWAEMCSMGNLWE